MTNRMTPESDVRELARRAGDGIEVTLLWSAQRGRLWVQVHERGQGRLFEVMAAPDQALNAFYHPHAYAALTGRDCADVTVASAR